MSKITRFAATVAAVALAGCAASGTQLSREAATQFVEGKTTKQEVIAKLGKRQVRSFAQFLDLLPYGRHAGQRSADVVQHA